MVPIADRRLVTFFARVYRPLRLRGKSANTVRLYGNTFANFAKYLGREATLDDLSDDVVGGLLSWHTDKGNSPDTANKDACQILAVWRFAARKGYLAIWPDVQLLQCPKRVPRAWLAPELEKLFDAVSREPGVIAGVRASIWWKALLAVLFFTAERIGAVMRVEWESVDLENGWVVMFAETRKGGRSDKSFPLPPDVIDLLKQIRGNGCGRVFKWSFDSTYIYGKYKKILQRAGLPTDRKSKFHRIRKTTASMYKAAGGDPTELLDHADPKTTKKYLDPRICGDQLTTNVLRIPWRK